MSRARGDRRQEILAALASELERRPGDRVTTAQLATVLGVSEAALYRHFPSKARMYEGLIGFAEESVFALFTRILREEADNVRRCESFARVLLTFSARNPGITRVLLGEALVGENERLRARVAQFLDRCETQLRQVLNECELETPRRLMVPASTAANLLVSVIEGRMAQYLRSSFRRAPDAGWGATWGALESALFLSDHPRKS